MVGGAAAAAAWCSAGRMVGVCRDVDLRPLDLLSSYCGLFWGLKSRKLAELSMLAAHKNSAELVAASLSAFRASVLAVVVVIVDVIHFSTDLKRT